MVALARSLVPLAVVGLLAIGAPGCRGTTTGTIRLEVGEEADALSRAPAPMTLVVSSVDLEENAKEIARAPLPASEIDLGDVSKTDVGAVRVAGLLADGTTVVRGTSLYAQWGALELGDLPVFVQRTGELARLPRTPSLAASATVLVNGRYVLEAMGTTASLYDLLQLVTFASSPTLPRPARSLASYGTIALVMDEQGATAFDLQDGKSYEVPAPVGGAFAEIAGGLTVYAKDGTQLVVGATRAGAPTARVLRIDPSGNVSFVSLASPRAGACAAFVEGRGLVVWGGSDAAPGGEVLAVGATAAISLPFPPDAVTGCALGALDGGRVVVAGGVRADAAAALATGIREIDLACAAACTPRAWPGEVPLVRAGALGIGRGAAFVAGDDAAGVTRAFRIAEAGAREVPTRAPRRGALLLPSPTGGVLVVSGGPGIEQYQD
jgi:hypothetical protein